MKIIKKYLVGLSLMCLVSHNVQSIGLLSSFQNLHLPSPKTSIPYIGDLYCIVSAGCLLYLTYYTSKYTKAQHALLTTSGKKTDEQKNTSPKITTTFNDIAGATVAKEELQDLVTYLKNPTEYTKLGAQAPKGILLYGPPGTGKTLLAKAVAGQAGCEFIAVNGTDFVQTYVGTGAETMRTLFAQARSKTPCIIFIDEIDTIGRKRERSYGRVDGSNEYANTLNQLLTEMDGFQTDNNPIIVIAATNKLDILDDALLRPGRFDKKIHVPLPTQSERLEILKVHAKGIILSSAVDLELIARQTTGFSGAELAELLKDAARIATKIQKSAVDMHDIELARDTIIMGQENKSLALNDAEKKQIAYHEAGHALVRLIIHTTTGASNPLHKVTILPRGSALGLTWSMPTHDRYTLNKKDLEAEIASALGGRIAEELIFDTLSTGAASDLDSATAIARAMVCQYGMSKDVGALTYTYYMPYAGRTAELIDGAIRNIIDTQYAVARNILEQHIDKLHMLAQVLQEKETISADEIYILLNIK
ncbi:MAG TPA: AAA family ATPase [Candidatus Babeliales bacterium]|jgi:cell division protease FtsH|nr:AAA family ATPase [Candidatus Babeliales bacterium]